MMKKVTLKDIARKLNISSSTVSRAMHNDRVSPETRERVLKTARELGYFAQQAKTSMDIMFLTTKSTEHYISFGSNFYGPVLQNIQRTCQQAGYRLVTCAIEDKRSMQSMELPSGEGVAGFIVVGWPEDDLLDYLESLNTPVVMMDNYYEHRALNCIATDNIVGAYAATRHLLDLGHRRIACIGASQLSTSLMERVAGYGRAMEEVGLPTLIYNGIGQAEDGRRLSKRAIEERDVTALFCVTDETGVGSLKGIHELSLSVPDDVSVVSFDNTDLVQYCIPPLTAVSVDRDAMGRLAARRVLELIRQEELSVQKTRIGTELIVRESTIGLSRSRASCE